MPVVTGLGHLKTKIEKPVHLLRVECRLVVRQHAIFGYSDIIEVELISLSGVVDLMKMFLAVRFV